jgi:hypothetical protein
MIYITFRPNVPYFRRFALNARLPMWENVLYYGSMTFLAVMFLWVISTGVSLNRCVGGSKTACVISDKLVPWNQFDFRGFD